MTMITHALNCRKYNNVVKKSIVKNTDQTSDDNVKVDVSFIGIKNADGCITKLLDEVTKK